MSPVYGTLANVPAIMADSYPQNIFKVWSAEALVAGEYSQQVNIPPSPSPTARGIRVVVDFNANPGNVEIQVMGSDNDSQGSTGYSLIPLGGDLTQANLIAGPNGASTRLLFELIPFAGQFVCLYVPTAPSNGNIVATATIARAA